MRKFFPVALAGVMLWHFALGSAVRPAQAQGNNQWTTLKGQIVYGGNVIPQRMPLNVTKDQQVCLAKGPLLAEEWVVDAKTKGVKNVFVWLAVEPGPGAALPIHPNLAKIAEPNVTMDQPVCAFEPHAVALRQGQTLIVKNSAAVAHNVNWSGRLPANPGDNKMVPAGAQQVIANLKADRLPVKISCNIHPWMNAWVRIFDHPYYAVTDDQGRFEIKDAPVGKFRLFVWHEGAGWRNGAAGRNGEPIEIKAGAAHDAGKLDIKESS